jgi:hypothetical protein
MIVYKTWEWIRYTIRHHRSDLGVVRDEVPPGDMKSRDSPVTVVIVVVVVHAVAVVVMILVAVSGQKQSEM